MSIAILGNNLITLRAFAGARSTLNKIKITVIECLDLPRNKILLIITYSLVSSRTYLPRTQITGSFASLSGVLSTFLGSKAYNEMLYYMSTMSVARWIIVRLIRNCSFYLTEYLLIIERMKNSSLKSKCQTHF